MSNCLYLDRSFRRRLVVPTRESAVFAFAFGVVLGVAVLGVGWLVVAFAQRWAGV